MELPLKLLLSRFLNVGPDENEYLYDYNPCSTFTSKCGSAYVSGSK